MTFLRDGHGNPIGIHGVTRDISKRVEKERELKEQKDRQKILLSVSEKIINADSKKMNSVIESVLSEVAKISEADRIYVFEHDYDKEVTNNIYKWCDEGIELQIYQLQKVPFTEFERWMYCHRKDESIIVNDVNALPQGDPVRKVLESQGIKSLLSLPIFFGNELFGFIRFDSVRNHHVYTEQEQALLRQFANNLVMTINKERYTSKLEITEKRLFSTNNLLDSTFNAIQDGISVLNTDLTIKKINQKMSKFYGEENVLVGRYCYEAYQNRKTPCDNCPVLKSMETKKTCSEIVPMIVDGQQIGWLEVFAYPMIDSSTGNVDGVVEFVRDITQRKNAEQEKYNLQKRLQMIMETFPDGIIVLYDRQFRYHLAEGSGLANVGLSKDDMLGKTVRDLFPADFSDMLEEKILNAFEGVQETFEIALGNQVFIQTVLPLENEPGKIEHVLGVITDITERKKAEKKLKESEKRYRSIISVSNTGAWEYHIKDNYLWCSPEYFDMLGRNISEYKMDGTSNLEESWIDLLHPEDKIRASSLFKEYSENGSLGMYENYFRMKHADGSWVWICSRGQTLKNEDGSPSNLCVGTHINITELKQMEQDLLSEKEQLKTTLLSVGDGVISTDKEGNVLILNPIAEQLTGWTQDEAIGRPIEEVFNIFNESTRKRCENPVQKVLDTGDIIQLANHTMLMSKDGIERPVKDSAAPIIDNNGCITGVVLVFRDFTEKKKSQDEIKYLSFHDSLTGLYNRRFFESEMKKIDTESNLPITIIMGDVNGLKLINDSFGHSVGDELLIKAAKTIKDCFGEGEIIARIGGDEIAVLLTKTSESEARKIVKKLKRNINKERINNLEMSISFGWKTKTEPTESLDLVLKKAEDHMYNNKLFESPSVRGRAINNILYTINEKSPREKIHSERVSHFCVSIGRALEMDEEYINKLKVLGLFHDIGKIAVSNDILNKPSKLTDKEYKEIRRHAEIGYRILSTANDMSEIAEYALFHHERWDGKGYPKGLKADSIPLPSRICAIADAYDAMTSNRSYRPAMTNEFALEELKKNSGTQFDPDVLKVFIDRVLSREKPNN